MKPRGWDNSRLVGRRKNMSEIGWTALWQKALCHDLWRRREEGGAAGKSRGVKK